MYTWDGAPFTRTSTDQLHDILLGWRKREDSREPRGEDNREKQPKAEKPRCERDTKQ